MSLSNDKSLHRVREKKPKMWCLYGRSRHAPIVPVEKNTVVRCRIDDCSCRHIDGWISVCDLCGTVLHSCPWGCYYPIQSRKIANMSDAVRLHGMRFHAGMTFKMEFPVFYPE